MVQQQNVATVVDLRSDAERDLAPCSLIDRHPAGHLNASYDAALIFPPSAGFEEEGGAFNDLHQSLYAVFAETLAPKYKAMFAALLCNETPMIVHCSAGQDRTGRNCPDSHRPRRSKGDDLADYLLSTEARVFENELDRGGLASFVEHNAVAAFFTMALRERGEAAIRPKQLVDASGAPLLTHGLANIEQRCGSVEAYLGKLSVGPAEQALLRNLYLEPE